MEISRSAKVIKSTRTLVQELQGEAVVLNLDNNQYYRLDGDSLRMFTVVTGCATLADAHAALLAEYAVAPEKLWQDLVNFVDEMARAGLVRVVDEPLA